ncbi:MAG TPA: hypothetical protein VED59_03025 [Acidimicrobiales bacterium]|nr:hypothetical protein [Acidimicrobiales bacterium]
MTHLAAMVDVIDVVEGKQDRLDVRKGGGEVRILDYVGAYLPHHGRPNRGLNLSENVKPMLERQEPVFAQVIDL